MKVLVTSEYRFVKTPDQKVWTQTAFPYVYWKKYLQVFDQVLILGRAAEVDHVDDNWKEVTGIGISFVALPAYRGLRGYVGALRQMIAIAAASVRDTDAAILALPSPIALIVGLILLLKKKSYAVEVMGDPFDVFARGGVRHPLRPALRMIFTVAQKILVRQAVSAAYVTQSSLQSRYPSGPRAHAVGVSNIDLNFAHLAARAREFSAESGKRTWRLVCVGSLEQLYKGPDLVLQAIAELKKEGFSLRLSWAGEGNFLAPMRELSVRLGLEHEVDFLGAVAGGDGIRALLDQSDLFVMASRTEGLPRAMIEAMARGLPCLGAAVGGIPELLDEDQLFAPGDVKALTGALRAAMSRPDLLAKAAEKNLEKSKQFLSSRLETKWSEFLGSLSKNLDNCARSRSD